MCDICKEILGSCVRRHMEKDCALKKASYCTGCAVYGHTFHECSNTVQDIEFLEQLIPPCFGIHSNTSLNDTLENKLSIECYIPTYYRKQYFISTNVSIVADIKPMKATIDVVNSPKAIRDLLKAYGQMPKKDNRNKDKYKVYLEKFAKKNNYNIVYHTPEQKDESTLDE